MKKITYFAKYRFLFLLIFLFIILFFIRLQKQINEPFFSSTPNTPLNYKPWSYTLQPYDIDPVTTYRDSSNYSKIWRGKETGNGDLRVADVPLEIFTRILPFYNQMNKADIGYIDKYYKQIPRVKLPAKLEKKINNYSKNAEIVNDDHFTHYNNRIWTNRKC
jgi:hypothetical protein